MSANMSYYNATTTTTTTLRKPKFDQNIKVPAINRNAPKAPRCLACVRKPTISITRFDRKKSEVPLVGPVENWFVRKLTGEIESFRKTSCHEERARVAQMFVGTLKNFFPEAHISQYGSFAAGLDVSTSDLDFSVRIEGVDHRSLLRMVHKKLQSVSTFAKVSLIGANVPVIKIIEKQSKISIDVCAQSEEGMRNTQLLACYAEVDKRVPVLIKAVKAWAAESKVEGSADGKLNGLSICLMVISFLQVGVSPCVVPNLQELLPELRGEWMITDDVKNHRERAKELVAKLGFLSLNQMEVGALYLAFLKYYADFDFKKNWISVRRGAVLVKERDEDGNSLNEMPQDSQFIVIQDPHIDKNCGYTLRNSRTFERLQLEFKLALDRVFEIKSIFEVENMSEWRRQLEKELRARDKQLEVERKEYIEKNGKDAWKTAPHGENEPASWFYVMWPEEPGKPVKSEKPKKMVPWPIMF